MPNNATSGDPSHTVWTRGTTTFVLTREAPPLRAGSSADAAEVERAYRRPPNDPPPR